MPELEPVRNWQNGPVRSVEKRNRSGPVIKHFRTGQIPANRYAIGVADSTIIASDPQHMMEIDRAISSCETDWLIVK
jgi:hypothetical protein